MPENILFEGEFNPADFIKGIDMMIDKNKQLQAQEKELQSTLEGTSQELKQKDERLKSQQVLLDNLRESNRKLKESYDAAAAAATNLQKSVGKPLGAALNSNQAITNIQKLTASIETLRAKMLVKQELLIKETDIAKIGKYNKEIQKLQQQITNTTNIGRKGFDDMGKAMKPQEGILQRLTRQAQLYAKAMQEATLPENITKYNQKLEATNTEIKKLSSTGKSAGNAFEKSFGLVRTLANILPGLGISGIFLLLYEGMDKLVEVLFKGEKALNSFKASQKDLNEAIASSEYTKAIENVNELKINIDLAKQGLLNKTEVLHEYNRTIGKTIGEVKSLDEAEIALGRNADAYIQMTLFKAAANIAGAEAAKKLVEAEQIHIKQRKEFANALVDTRISIGGAGGLGTGAYNAKDAKADEERRQYAMAKRKAAAVQEAKDAAKVQLDIQKTFTQQAAEIATKFKFDFFGGKEDPKKGKEAPENVYRQKLQELKAKLAAINESIFTSEGTIKAKVAEEVKKGNEEYDRLFKEKKLTGPELASLKALNSSVGKAEMAKEMKAFNEKRKAAQKQIDDELEKLRAEDVEKRIANIKGEFEQELAVIQLEDQKQRDALNKNREAELEDLAKKNALGLISDDALLIATTKLEEAYAKLFADVDAFTARKQAELSQKSFERSVEGIKDVFAGTLTVQSEETTQKINSLTESYLQGTISYKKYQREMTKTLREETKERLKIELLELNEQLNTINGRLNNPKPGDSAEFRKKLKTQQLAIRNQISANKRGTANADASDENDEANERLQKLKDYITVYEAIASAIVSVWQTANEAEAKALDRSIAIQQRRVDAAQRIADRGNATYLKAEEDRMNDLRVKQEANARRQIAINAAIQGSQLLVAITGAAAQIATPGAGPALVIGSIATIIGSLAAGYALVKSLQQNQPSFYVGTEDTGKGGNIDSKGGFQAILHPNERVITAEHNKELKGLSNEQLIETVNQHKMLVEHLRTPALPELNYDRLESAAHFHITHDGRLVAMMEENNMRQEETLSEMRKLNKNIRNISNSVVLDRNGIAVSLMAAVDQFKIDKKA